MTLTALNIGVVDAQLVGQGSLIYVTSTLVYVCVDVQSFRSSKLPVYTYPPHCGQGLTLPRCLLCSSLGCRSEQRQVKAWHVSGLGAGLALQQWGGTGHLAVRHPGNMLAPAGDDCTEQTLHRTLSSCQWSIQSCSVVQSVPAVCGSQQCHKQHTQAARLTAALLARCKACARCTFVRWCGASSAGPAVTVELLRSFALCLWFASGEETKMEVDCCHLVGKGGLKRPPHSLGSADSSA
jgi:hypothetical protein